jgi:hypothetical protein
MNTVTHNRTGVLTDAQRLEFIFKNNPVFGSDDDSTWMAVYVNGQKAITEGKTHRECIDNLTTGNYWFAA